MSPVQIIRTVAVALITGGLALGLVPSEPCGAGWWEPSNAEELHGWFAMGGGPSTVVVTCESAMAPVGSWAVALIVVGATLLLGAWFHTSYRPEAQPDQPTRPEQ